MDGSTALHTTINKHFNFCCFRALAYTTLDRLCAVFLYNWLIACTTVQAVTVADLESDAGGARRRAPKAQASRREAPRSSADGARGGVWGGGIPLPTGRGVWGGARPPPQKIFYISELKWCVLVHFTRKNSDTIGLEKLALFSLCVVVVK